MNHYIAVGIVLIVIVALMATNKKLVETLKNIYKIEELRKRILYTLGLLLVYRLGSFVVIPGINPNALGEGSALANQMSDNSLLGLLDVFSGGAFGNAAIFALGVMPYITASIIIQLMGIMIILELVLLALVFMATIALVQAVRKVPVQYAKRIIGNKQYGGVRQYIPLKMNAANVMPIIFAQALMFIPMLFTKIAPGFAGAFADMTGFWYNFTLAVLVIAFTYFYTAIIVNPQMMADDMKRNGGFIPGVKPGKQTVNYIDTIMTRITLPGSFFLAIVAILPALAMKFLNVQQAFAYFYGGTSLLIMVGVILDTLKQIESHLLMRHYDGLMKTGRIQGRH